MTTINARLHPAQKEIHRSPARFKVVDAGRRFGKTRLCVLECYGVAAAGGRAWWVAPSYGLAKVGWRPIKNLAGKIPGAQVRLSDRTVILSGGGEISVRSADNPDSLRGEGLDLVCLDEAAYMKQDAWREVLRPALSDRLGKAIFISTPNGLNWFWELYQRGISQAEGWASFKFPTSSNPFINQSEIDAAKADLPELIYHQEYEAEFVSLEGAVFRRVQEAVKSEIIDAPLDGRRYIASVDVAASVDFTVCMIWDVASNSVIYIDRYNRLDYTALEDRLHAIYQRFRLDAMTIESNSIGQGVIDHLQNEGMSIYGFVTTSGTKQAIIQGLQSGFEHGLISIPKNEILLGELLSYEGQRSPSGSFAYSAPDGLHDDTVMALAIGWDALGDKSWHLAGSRY